MKVDLEEIKEATKRNSEQLVVVDHQRKEIEELKKKIEGFSVDSSKKLEETRQLTQNWSSLFQNKVDSLVSDVGVVQKSVEATKTSFEASTDRLNRRNNIVVYNMLEKETKSADKEEILKMLKEIAGRDFNDEIEFLRLGRKNDESKRARPVLIKFNSLGLKNLVFENTFRLKKSESFSKVILNNDLSKEDREKCSKLLQEKKDEIGKKEDTSKWVFRIRGQPGDFHAVAFRRRNF